MISKLISVVCVLAVGTYLAFNIGDFMFTKSAKADYLNQLSLHTNCKSAGNVNCPRKPSLAEYGLDKSDFE